MLKIDNTLLQEIGLGGLPDAEKNSLLKHIYETLEMRVGIRLADQMSNEQLDEFEQYFEAKDDAGAFKWLETNFPNYKEIVQEEFDKLKLEVSQAAPQILSAGQQHQAAPGTAAIPPQPIQQPPSSMPPAPAAAVAPQQQYAPAQYQQAAAPQPAWTEQPQAQPFPQADVPQQPYPTPAPQPIQQQPAPQYQPQPPQPQYQQQTQPLPNVDQQQPYAPYPSQQPPAGPGQ
jgi:hypothetical protein